MASSSPTKRYHIFVSSNGQDVHIKFLTHLHKSLERKGIKAFKDQEIERGHHIKPELFKAITESRVSMVVLSKNYASSSWCLDELVEILKCEEDSGQTVMTIFYDINPSDVRNQKGDFGEAFEKTCEGKTEEMKHIWTEALSAVANIEGEYSLNWANEADMIQTITTDVSKKLRSTLPSDFNVGQIFPLRKLHSLLCLDKCAGDVKMIGIQGGAEIGKTRLAGALYEELSNSFELKCFMGNLNESCKSYDSQIRMQSKLLAEIFDEKDTKIIHNLRAVEERLHDQRVLIILDDVDHIKQLKTLAKKLSWFGPGSRIIVITEDKKILKKHKIRDIYHMYIGTHIASYAKAWSVAIVGFTLEVLGFPVFDP